MKIDIDDEMVSHIVIQDLKGYHEIMKDNPGEAIRFTDRSYV